MKLYPNWIETQPNTYYASLNEFLSFEVSRGFGGWQAIAIFKRCTYGNQYTVGVFDSPELAKESFADFLVKLTTPAPPENINLSKTYPNLP